MTLRCVIIEDEPMARKLLLDYCSRVSEIEVVKEFTNGLDALPYLNNNPIDLLFIDIKMPGITGVDLVKTLQNKPKIIFTTAFAEYAVDGFELDATDYLLKPFNFPRFIKAVNKVLSHTQASQPNTDGNKNTGGDYIFIKDGRDMVKVPLAEILYIKGQKDYVKFTLRNRKIMSLMNMKDLENSLAEKGFLRIHQSFIINTAQIEVVSNNSLKINGEFLPISQTYKQGFKKFLDKHQH
ncbi:LytR/AlgR family response regulator transcription factor [Fulvivirga lutimaris]|uniref:LytR/AlgR family response regulator transcription factor n=1 Tax=Fulvivirga lutimaris TaxID=1819566 RepID=UPI0012BCB7CF|nr:LytTR family DNA-binding domain-containing protein [Fulvivirga lutimaris]MTI40875.1 response regulator transcription factor [Fulvivirga lutimaris]